MSQCKKRFLTLDGWRFWAIVVILIHHINYYPYFTATPEGKFKLVDVAMPFFFMLSGFAAAATVQNFKWDFHSTVNYFIARIIRIWVPHVIALVSFIVLFFSICNISLPIFWANFFLVQSWIPDDSYFYAFNAPTWYLSNLLWFFFFMPVFVKNFKLCLCCSIILPVGMTFFISPYTVGSFCYILPLSNMFKFLLGMLIYRFIASVPAASNNEKYFPISFILWTVGEIVITAVLISIVYCPFESFFRKYLNVGLSFLIPRHIPVFFLLIFFWIFSNGKGLISKLLSSRISQIGGKISFTLFLWHWIIRGIILRYDLFHHISVQWRMFLFVIVCIMFSAVWEYCINIPITRLLISLHKKHPLNLEGIKRYCAWGLWGFFVLYLFCVIPLRNDYSDILIATAQIRSDNSLYAKVVKYSESKSIFIHPGEKPTSVIFQLGRQVNEFSCRITRYHKKGDVIINFYLDDKLVKTVAATGELKDIDVNLLCSGANGLRVEVDKNNKLYCDGILVKNLSFIK